MYLKVILSVGEISATTPQMPAITSSGAHATGV